MNSTIVGIPVVDGAVGAAYAEFFNEMQGHAEGALMALASRLNSLGQYRDALSIADVLIKGGRDVTAAQCLAVDSLLKMELSEDAISRLAGIAHSSSNSHELSKLINDALILGVGRFNRLLEEKAFGSALALAESMVVLAPTAIDLIQAVTDLTRILGDSEKHQAGLKRIAELRTNEFLLLIKAADKCYEQRDFEAEIKIRLQVFRSPLDLGRIPAFRVENIYLILSRLVIKPMDNEAILLAKELISHVPPANKELFQQPLDHVARHERFLRHSIGCIDMNTVFGPPLTPRQGPLLSFYSSLGHPLSVDDIRNIIRHRDVKVGFFTSGSQLYFETCAPSYITSILDNCDLSELVFVCAEGGWGTINDVVEMMQIDDPRVIYCIDESFCDDGDWKVFGPEETPRTVPTRYACVGLLALSELLSDFNIPFFLTGLDTILQRGVGDLVEQFTNCDIVFNKIEHGHRIGSYFVNSLGLIYPTDNAMLLARFLSCYLGALLEERVQPFALDQQVLVMAWQHLLFNRPDAHIGFFSEFDINNLMFNQENIEQHRDLFQKFRFVNIFKEGQQGKSLK